MPDDSTRALTPTEIAEKKTREYLSGPWYRRLLTGAVEGLAAYDKNYRTPMERFYERALEDYRAETPRIASGQRAEMAEKQLKEAQRRLDETLQQRSEENDARLQLGMLKAATDRIKAEAMAGRASAAADLDKARAQLGNLSGNAGLMMRLMQDPKLAETYQDIQRTLSTDTAMAREGAKAYFTPDKPPGERTQLFRGTDMETGLPKVSPYRVQTTPGVNNEALRNRAAQYLFGRNLPPATETAGGAAGVPQVDRTLTPEQKRAVKPPVLGLGAFPQETRNLAEPPKVPQPAQGEKIPLQPIREKKTFFQVPAYQFPERMRIGPDTMPGTQTEKKNFDNQRTAFENSQNSMQTVINSYVTGDLEKYASLPGRMRAAVASSFVGPILGMDPVPAEVSALVNLNLDSWKAKLYSETGMQANQIEMNTARQYFLDLMNNPDAILKKALFLGLMARAKMDLKKLPMGHGLNSSVNTASVAAQRAEELYRDLKNNRDLDLRKFDLKDEIWELAGSGTPPAKPASNLDRWRRRN